MYHPARPCRGDGLCWRLLVTAEKLSGPVLTFKLCQRHGRFDIARPESAQADSLQRCPHPWVVLPPNWREAPTSLEPSAEATRPIIGSSHVSHFLYWPLQGTFFDQNVSVGMTCSFCSFMSMKLLKVFNLQ